MTDLIAERPVPGAPRAFKFPAFTRERLSNGLTVVACDIPGRPLVTAKLIAEAGGFNEDPQRAGVALLTARGSTEGTRTLPGTRFAEAVESLGADVNVAAGWETITYTMRAPVSRAEAAMTLLADVVQAPEFPESEIERLRAERINEIKQQDAQPFPRGVRALLEAIYTPESPYHRRLGGTLDSVATLTRDVVEMHHKTYVTPGSATLILAGDLSGVPAVKVAEDLFGAWAAAEPPRVAPSNTDRVGATHVTIVNKPGAVQSNIAAGHIGIARGERDELAVELMNHALGGSFNSRINQKLREEKGFTYGARSIVDTGRLPGPMLAYAPVETGVTADALADLMQVVRDVHGSGISDDELDEARAAMTGVFALRFETPEAIASGLEEIVIYGLPDDYFDTYGAALSAVTLEEVNAAAAARLRPDATAIVVVGDAEKLAADLERFGPVSVVDDGPR